MNSKLRFVFLVIFMAVLMALLLYIQFLREENEITFFITGDLQGYLIPCGCRTSPAGGLSRRLPILEKIKRDHPKRKIVSIELPNVFTDRSPSKDIINKKVGNFLFENNYLVCLGERDLLFGEKLKEYFKGEYFISGVEGFNGEKTIELGGFKGLPLGEKGKIHLLFLSELSSIPDVPAKIFSEKAQKYKDDAFLIFGNMSPQTVEKLLKENVKILGIFASWGNTVTTLPQKAKDSWVVFIGDKGRRFATFDIEYYDGKWATWAETSYIDREFPFNEIEEEKIEKTLRIVEENNEEILSKIARKFEGKSDYMGSSHCKSCHKVEYETWEKTNHFSATKRLEIDHQERNPDCLICHSTGFGKGGYPDTKIDFTGVGCEVCHGPGKKHPSSKMKIEKSVEFCLACHTKRDSPYFNEGYLMLISHSQKKKQPLKVIEGVSN